MSRPPTILSPLASLLAALLIAACGSVSSQGDGDGDAGGGCEADQPLRCDGDTLISCASDGATEVETTCPLRCNSEAPACEDVSPANGLADHLDAAAAEPALVIDANAMIQTEDFEAASGTVSVGGSTVKAALVPGVSGSPEILVLSVGGLTIEAGSTLSLFGDRAVAIVSHGDIVIDGDIVVRAGGSLVPETCWGTDSAPTGNDNDVPGAGGGSFGARGGNGGGINGVASAKPAGAVTGVDVLEPLRGGCPGGFDGVGGQGFAGGALQLTSRSAITIAGDIGANGGGGAVGSGGGSGGGVLVEAPVVTIAGGLFANGGAGGCGGFQQSPGGQNSLEPALGDECPNGVRGGNGGAGTTAATSAATIANTVGTQDRAGAGGGGVGRIRINTADATVGGEGLFSPAPSLGEIGGR